MTTTELDAAAVLATAARARSEADAAEAQLLSSALDWALLHEVADLDLAARWDGTPLPLAGEGAPWIDANAVAEFAAVVGLSTGSGRALFAHVLEIAFRLPRVWARVQGGSLVAWRARRIAEETLGLSAEAAAFVDAQVAPFAHRVGVAQTQRLVDDAIARFMPGLAAERRASAADRRHFTVEHGQVSFDGTSQVHGELDLLDALDLDAAVSAEAEALRALGSTDDLDVRRSVAIGNLARRQSTLELPTVGRREVVLYVHLPVEGAAVVENRGPHLVTREQVAGWCGAPDTRVVVRPVIDLNKTVAVAGYDLPDRVREQVILRDRTCVFPHCTRPARACDVDHLLPYDRGGPTQTDNLAALCRHHHRLKTHTGWRYERWAEGVYVWHSPHGFSWIRDRHGTELLTADPPDPPGAG